MTPESLRLWVTMRAPVSRWRRMARETIREVVAAHPELLADNVKLLAAIDREYPFRERRMLPYKMWLLERKLFRNAMTVPAATPSRDEVEVCSVARDLVELGRADEARQLMADQAPNRIARQCPACGVAPGDHCVALGVLDQPHTWERNALEPLGPFLLIVPHEARLVGHLGAGPLFEARS